MALAPPEGVHLSNGLEPGGDAVEVTPADVLAEANALRWEVASGFHDSLMQAIYADAARIAGRAFS